MACAVLAVVAAGYGAGRLPRAFLPTFNEGSFTVTTTFTPGISLAESARVGAIAERLLMEIPEVDKVGRRTGRAELDEHAEGVHSTDLEIRLKPGGRERDAITAEIRGRLSVLPVTVNVGQPISHRLDHMLSGVRAEIALKLFGEDLDALRRTAESLRETLSGIPGVADLQVERQVRVPQIEVRVDPAKAALYGVSPATVVETVGNLANGAAWSRPWSRDCARFDVVLRLPESGRSMAALRDLLIETPSGWVPAHALADIAERDGPNQIQRENGRRRIVVQANTVPGSDGSKVAAAIGEALARTDAAGGDQRAPRRCVRGARGGDPPHRPPRPRLLRPGLRAAGEPLPLRRAGAHRHGQRAARPHRQRRRPHHRRAAPLRGLDDRLRGRSPASSPATVS